MGMTQNDIGAVAVCQQASQVQHCQYQAHIKHKLIVQVHVVT